jgi:uncharacterized membrane protein YeaQ/YmgE (transglycosylase-associated protein family)
VTGGGRAPAAAQPDLQEILMAVVAFIFIGLLAGYVALGIFRSTSKRGALDFGVAVTGAVIAGWLFNFFAGTGAEELEFAGALIAITGSAVLLAASHAMVDDSRSRPRDPG